MFISLITTQKQRLGKDPSHCQTGEFDHFTISTLYSIIVRWHSVKPVSIYCSWERRVDSRNRIYYVDHNTRSTTWQRPTRQRIQVMNEWRSQRDNMQNQRQVHCMLLVIIQCIFTLVCLVTFFSLSLFNLLLSCVT